MTAKDADGRAGIIEAVRTPLGFYALVILVVEAILGATVTMTSGLDRHLLVFTMAGTLLLLILLVAGISLWRPRALYGEITTTTVVTITNSTPAIWSNDARIVVVDGLTAHTETFSIPHRDSPDRDAEVIRSVWPSAELTYMSGATAETFTTFMLNAGEIDVLHLIGHFDAQTGDVVFSDRVLPAAGFAQLMQKSSVKLAVLAACQSASLGAEVAPLVNLVALTDNRYAENWQPWNAVFYQLLGSGTSFSEAFQVAKSTVDIPVIMWIHEDFSSTKDQNKSITSN